MDADTRKNLKRVNPLQDFIAAPSTRITELDESPA